MISHGTVGGEPVAPPLPRHEQQHDGQPQVEKAPSTEPQGCCLGRKKAKQLAEVVGDHLSVTYVGEITYIVYLYLYIYYVKPIQHQIILQ